MAYGISFYKPNTTVFDATIAYLSTSTLANAKDADKVGNKASRGQVLEAFQGIDKAPILPVEADIRYWMGAGLGYKKQTFTTYYTSLYNSNSVYAASVIAGRAFEASVLSPLTATQDANQNGYPSGSTKDPWGNNNTSFLLGISDSTSTYDILGSTSYGISTVPQDYRLQNSMYFSGNTTFITASSSRSGMFDTTYNTTLEVWVYLTDSSRETSIFSRLTASTINQLGYDIYINSGGYLVWELPPWSTLYSDNPIPTNTWVHLAVSTHTYKGTRLYVNGVVSVNGTRLDGPEDDAKAPNITKVVGFLGSSYSHLEYYNCISVSDATGFSIYDKIKFYGTAPVGQPINSSEYTIVAVDYVRNLIDLYQNISTTYTPFTCLISRSIASTPARSASRRYVVAGSVSDNTRLYLDPQGTPMGYQYYNSGVAEQEMVTGRAVASYMEGDTVVFSGTMRGGLLSNVYYYIASVVTFSSGSNFGGYVTLTRSLTKSYINGVYTYTPVYISYFTDYGSTYVMIMNKVGVSGGYTRTAAGFSTTSLLVGSTNNSNRSTSTTYFKGFLYAAKFDGSADVYNSTNFTPTYQLSSTTSNFIPLLLINTDGEKLVNNPRSDVGYPTITYNNISDTHIYTKFNYLGTAVYSGTNSYSIVQGSRSYIGPSTNWCAEAWIYPIGYNGGIIGSGASETNSWGLILQSDGKLTFQHNPGTYITSTSIIAKKTWAHVAVSLNGNTLRIFINGVQEAATEITPHYFYPYSGNGFCYIGYYNGAFFTGAISNARLVNGSSVYTTNFIPSTTKPRAARTAVLNAYAANNYGPVIPSELEQQVWMDKGFDTFKTVLFSSADITWNQVDSFYVNGGSDITKTYASCVGREISVNQILIGTPDINKAYYANILATNNSNGSVHIYGGNVDAYITVLMR